MSWFGVNQQDMSRRAMLLAYMYRPYGQGEWVSGKKFMPPWQRVLQSNSVMQWFAAAVNAVLVVGIVWALIFLWRTALQNAVLDDMRLFYVTLAVFFLPVVYVTGLYARDTIKLICYLLAGGKRI